MRLTVTSHLTLDGVMQSNGKPEPELNDGFEQGGWHDLVDEYRLLIHPVVLGSGKRLFADGTTPAALELTGTQTTSRGVAVHIYQPSGKPLYGSAVAEREGDIVRDSVSRQAVT
jgi:hypothetical protein